MVSYTGPGEELESTLLTLGKGKVTKSDGQTYFSRASPICVVKVINLWPEAPLHLSAYSVPEVRGGYGAWVRGQIQLRWE